MPRAATIAAPVVLALMTAVLAPRGAAALTVNPTLDFEVREDHLPGREPAADGWVARITPQLTLIRTGLLSTLEIGALRSFDTNRSYEGPEQAGDAGRVRFNATPTAHSEFDVDAAYVSSRDPLGSLAAPPLTFQESAIASGGTRLQLWRAEGEFRVRNRTYENPGERDGFSQSWRVSAFPFRHPETIGVVSAYGRDSRVENSKVLRTRAVTMGIRRTHFLGLSSELELGAATSETNGGNTTDLAVIAGLRADRWTLRQPFDLRAWVMHDVENTGFIEASVPGRSKRLAVRAEQTLGAEGGFFEDPTLARYLTFDARDTLAGDYALSLEGSIGQTRSQIDAGPWVKTQRLWASVSRHLSPWMTAAVDYSFVNQDGDSVQPTWVFRRNRLGLRLTLGAQ